MNKKIKVLKGIGDEYLYNYFCLRHQIPKDVEHILMELLGFNKDGSPYKHNSFFKKCGLSAYNIFKLRIAIANELHTKESWRQKLITQLLENVYNFAIENYSTYKNTNKNASIFEKVAFCYRVNGKYHDLVDSVNIVIKNILEDKSKVSFVVFKEIGTTLDLSRISRIFEKKCPGLISLLVDDTQKDFDRYYIFGELGNKYADYFKALVTL